MCLICGGDALWCRCTQLRIANQLRTATGFEAYIAGYAYGETMLAREERLKAKRAIRLREDEDV